MKEENKKRGRGRPKKKEGEEEIIGDGEQEDINEADDTFGLPDIELKPLDEVEEEIPDDSPVDELASEEDIPDDEPVDEPAIEEDVTSTDQIDNEFEEPESDSVGEQESVGSEDDKTEEYKPAFQKKYEYKEEKSAAPKIILSIIGVLLIAAGVYYFGFYVPEQKAVAEKKAQDDDAAKKIADDEARDRKLEQDRLAREQAEADALAAQEEQIPTVGEINIITEPTGRYYVVIGSFVDEDLAMDYGKDLSELGIGSMILRPGQGKFNRLALSDFGSWNEAQLEADNLKSEYSDALWVLKY